MTVPLSPEREQQYRAEILAALSTAGAFCGECGFEPGETGCADCVRVRELYADAVMPIIDRLRAELAQVRSNALREAAEVADKAGTVYAARGDNDRAGAAFAVMEQLVDMAAAVVPAAGEAGR